MIYETLPEFAEPARTFMDAAAQRYRQLGEVMTGLLKHETAATFHQLDAIQREASENIFGPPDTGDTSSGRLNGAWVDEDDDLLPRMLSTAFIPWPRSRRSIWPCTTIAEFCDF